MPSGTILRQKHEFAKSIGKPKEKHTFCIPRWLQNAARWPQDRSKSPLGRSWSLLARSWAAPGRSWPLLARSWCVLGRSWSLLGRSWAVLGRSWGDLGGSWGDLGRPRGVKIQRGSAVIARRVAPPRDFLRKFLPSRDLEITTYIRDLKWDLQHAVLRWGRRIEERFARPPPPPSGFRPL